MTKQELLFREFNSSLSLSEIQRYFEKIFIERGFVKQKLEDKALLLIEEVGELAKAIRREQSNLGIDYSRIENYDSIGSELADIFIVIISICELTGIDLFDELKCKEKINIQRKWKNSDE